MLRIAKRAIIAFMFSVPAAVFAWWAVDRTSPEVWRWIPLSVAIGTFLTTLIGWPLITRDQRGLLRCILAGGLIGLFSHPSFLEG